MVKDVNGTEIAIGSRVFFYGSLPDGLTGLKYGTVVKMTSFLQYDNSVGYRIYIEADGDSYSRSLIRNTNNIVVIEDKDA